MRPTFNWRLRSRTVELGKRTLIMGVINVTPDSFYDGGRNFATPEAVVQGLRMLDDGADILDIGGESTRPGAQTGKEGLSAGEELNRVLPAIEGIRRKRPDALISIDTYKSLVAEAAVRVGAEVVNDVSACRWDPQMAATIARLDAGVVLMHMRGRPYEWRTLPRLESDELLALVTHDLDVWSKSALQAGIGRDRIVLDPGFGFGKNFEENYPLLTRFDELHQLGFPLLSGTSRKSFIGRALSHDGADVPAEDRLYGTLATAAISIMKGAHIVRVHDVKEAAEVARITDAVLAAQTASQPV
ncbi:MAG: dihydropteroate synthase [Acidobacteriales bacterium]|nr:dihydropteroate synthase [Terriglobales bacterium]